MTRQATDRLKGGELNAALTKALVRVHVDHLEHRPANATTFHRGHVVVAVMHDVLTNAEKILAGSGSQGDVREVRQLFQKQMEPDFRDAVERLTGCKVIAFFGGNHLEPDLAAEIFVSIRRFENARQPAAVLGRCPPRRAPGRVTPLASFQ